MPDPESYFATLDDADLKKIRSAVRRDLLIRYIADPSPTLPVQASEIAKFMSSLTPQEHQQAAGNDFRDLMDKAVTFKKGQES